MATAPPPPIRRLSPIAFLLGTGVAIAWGLNFVVIKATLADIGPLSLMALRFCVVAVVLVHPAIRRIQRDQILPILIFALVFGAAHFGLMGMGMQYVNASIAAVLIQTGVPIAFLISIALDGFRPSLGQSSGVIAAIVGTAMLTNLTTADMSLLGLALLLLSATAWAIGNRLRHRLNALSALQITVWGSALAAPVLMLGAVGFEGFGFGTLGALTPTALGAVLFLALISSLLGTTLWWSLVETYAFSQIAPFFLAAPVLGVFFSMALLGERLTSLQLCGAVLSLLGLAAIELRRK
ncbi:MAG: EamA family transporter [Rhodobacteraceae bacterium]|nr:EamA family transporter [Paracoccaceae bacterium]